MLVLRFLCTFCNGTTLTERIEKAHPLPHSISLYSGSWTALLGGNSLGCETPPAELGINPGLLCQRCVLEPLYQRQDGKATRIGALFQKINELCWVLRKGS